MQIIGNILLVIATLVFFSLLPAQLGFEKLPGGDARVGSAIALMMQFALFAISMLLLIIVIAWNGGFTWVAATKGARWLWVLGVIALIVTAIMYVNVPSVGDWNMPNFIRYIIVYIPVVLQLLALIAAYIFLHQKKIDSPVLLKGISLALIGISLFGVLITFTGQQIQAQQARRDFMKDNPNGLDDNEQRIMKEIDSCDVTKNMVFILVFTDANQNKLIREKAIAKVKTNANWQRELIARLQNDWAPEPFTFLASNNVDSPAIFIEPIRQGILIHAKLVKQKIKNAQDFDSDLFYWELKNVIRTVDKFQSKEVDYLPAMKELRKAFDEPSENEKSDFRITTDLDKWIKKHER